MWNYSIKKLFVFELFLFNIGSVVVLKQDESARSAKNKELLSCLNTETDPCQDFYEFACGNCVKNADFINVDTPILPQVIENNNNNMLKIMLDEKLTVQDDFNYGRKVKDFYKSCISAKRNDKIQQEFFSKVISENGGFPAVPGSNWERYESDYKWLDIIGKLRYNYAMDILIKIKVIPRKYYEYPTDKYIEAADTLIPSNLCNANATKTITLEHEEYDKIRNEVATTLSGWFTQNINDVKPVASQIVAFEYEICSGINVIDYNNDISNAESKNLDDLSMQLNDKINFKQLLDVSFQMQMFKTFSLKSRSYFKHLAKTIEATQKKSTIANYIMFRALSMLSLPSNEEPKKRTDYCLALMKRYFPKQIGEMYLKKFITDEMKDDIKFIFVNMTVAFASTLSESPWNDNVANSKLHGLKLSPTYTNAPSVNLQITAENFWQNLAGVLQKVHEDQKNYILDSSIMSPPDEVESYDTRLLYRPEKNSIEIGWGLLQVPYYHQQYPVVMRYAIIGQLFANELSKAFNYNNQNPSLTRRQRIQNSVHEFQKHLKCFQQQISNYLYNSPHNYNNHTEMLELIAVSHGVNIAFKAYLNWLSLSNIDQNTFNKETLHDLNFTNTQLFFITYAQLHCNANVNDTESTILLSALQRHSLQKYGINGPMMNSFEFATEFQCSLGVEMNTADKCVIF